MSKRKRKEEKKKKGKKTFVTNYICEILWKHDATVSHNQLTFAPEKMILEKI